MARLFPFAAAALVASGLACGSLGDPLPPAETEEPAAAPPPSGEKLYVVSATSLKIRSAPSADAPELANVPRGEAVIVTGPAQGKERIVGITGGWAPVWWNGTLGYAFDGYLLSVPPPPLPCASLATWAAAIGHAGTEAVVSRRSCADMDITDEGDCDTRWRTPLQGGGWFERSEGWEWGEEVIHIPGAARDAAWAAVRGCVGASIGAKERPLPDAAGPLPPPSEDIFELKQVSEAGRVGWEWSAGCGEYLYVEVIGDDVQVTEGGGC